MDWSIWTLGIGIGALAVILLDAIFELLVAKGRGT